VVSVATWELLDTVRVGLSPQYLSVDPAGERAYVPLFGNDQLAVLDIHSRSVESFLALGDIEQGPVGVAVSPDGGTVHVGAWAWDEHLLVVNPSPPVLFRRVEVGPATVGLALTADGRRVFLAQVNRVAVVDATTSLLADSIPVGAWALAFPTSGEAFCAVEMQANLLHQIRLED
jgi:DNA-binding beta-propeller fold protein YncE